MSDKVTTHPFEEGSDWRNGVTWYTAETGFARWLKGAARPLFQQLGRVQVTGQENIPRTGRLIVACNHISNYDVPYIVLNLPRHPFFMTKKELFENPLFSWMIRRFGGFPVNRGERDPWAISQAGRILEAEQLLMMFPEGTRSGPKAQLKRGKSGAVKLALDHQAPILPAAIFGTQHVRLGWRRPTEVSLQFGQPLNLVALAGPPPYTHDTAQALTDQVMRLIAAMLPATHRGVYAGPPS
jgi:1-acyl-sn-glycerol-3-phosphate acyltransferase